MKGLSRETRLLLERGRGETLEPEHRARLRRSVMAGAVGVSAAATTMTAGWTATAAKLVAALVVVGGATAMVATGAGTTKSQRSAETAASVRGAAMHAAPATPSEPVERAVPPSPPDPLPPTEAPASPPAPATTAAVAATAKVRAPAAEPTEAPVASSLQEEALLVREANDALEKGDPERAAALAEEHARRFPRGALLPEGAAVHILALCAAGNLAKARTETSTFLTAHPQGPLSMRVRSSCGGTP